MTTVKELMDYLETQNPEAKIKLAIGDSSYYDGPSYTTHSDIRWHEWFGTVILAGSTMEFP